MIAAPAVDLREGRCVQLVGGNPGVERISLPDPLAQARAWRESGFGTLHIVDLDAALSMGDNRDAIRTIVSDSDATLQVGGGVRDEDGVTALLEAGVHRVIVGTRAVDDLKWLARVTSRRPGRIMVATDIRDGMVLRKGWTESSGIPVLDLLQKLEDLPLAGVLCTDVGREGRMAGIDLRMAEKVVEGSRHPIWISGGISTMDELRALDDAGATGAVLGMSIYSGVLSPEKVAEEFGQ
jgi:phosphoribosylformimino-5-aminoimidazole carboxamide ribotide isomerase